MSLKYFFGRILAAPLLPLMYFEAKSIRKTVPRLPEAVNPEGVVTASANHNRTISILTIGESTIAGIGVKDHSQGFTGALAKELSRLYNTQIKYTVFAKSGYTAKKVTERLIPMIPEDLPIDLIVIGLGANEAFKLNSPKNWKNDVRKLLSALKLMFPGKPIVFASVPPIKIFPAFTPSIKFVIGNLVEILGDALDEVVKEFSKVYYLNQRITLDTWAQKLDKPVDPSLFFSDGVHPSQLTYQLWAKDTAEMIYRNRILKG
jgi:lysophospholipase L1-like esterase